MSTKRAVSKVGAYAPTQVSQTHPNLMPKYPDNASYELDLAPNVLGQSEFLLYQAFSSLWLVGESPVCFCSDISALTFNLHFSVFCQISVAESTPPTDTRKNKLLRVQTRQAAALSSSRESSRQSGVFSLLFLLSRRLEQLPCLAQECACHTFLI